MREGRMEPQKVPPNSTVNFPHRTILNIKISESEPLSNSHF